MSEFLVGVHGLRTFRVSDDGQLLPVTALDDSWRGGVCIARCRRRRTHRAPVDGCTCGVYTFRSLAVLRQQYPTAQSLVAVVALEGQTLAGAKGWRSEAGRVVALWTAPDAAPTALLAELHAHLPDVAVHDDVDTMLAAYPELSADVRPALELAPAAGPIVFDEAAELRRMITSLLIAAVATAVFLVAGRPGGPLADVNATIVAGFYSLLAWTAVLAALVRSRAHTLAGLLVARALGALAAFLVGGEIAALLRGDELQLGAVGYACAAVLVWFQVWKLAALGGRTAGVGGVLARLFLQVSRSIWRLLRRGGGNRGANFAPFLVHHLRDYPLVAPVHLSPA